MTRRRRSRDGEDERQPPPWGLGGAAMPPQALQAIFWGRAQRARRGQVRAAILGLLAKKPCNGYQIIQELEQRSRGRWRPSPGSIYPTLQQLEDEGLVQGEEAAGGGRTFSPTAKGKRAAEEVVEEDASAWEAPGGPHDPHAPLLETMQHVRQLLMAAMQVAH